MKKKPDHLRTVTFERRFTRHAEGSVLIKQGETWVLCTASVEKLCRSAWPPSLRQKPGRKCRRNRRWKTKTRPNC